MAEYRIKEIMKEKGITTISALADKIGIKANTLSERLSSSSLRGSTLDKIAEALGVPVWSLYKDAPEYKVSDRICKVVLKYESGKEKELDIDQNS